MVVREIYARLGIKVDKKSTGQAAMLFTEIKSKMELMKGAFEVAKDVVQELIGETVTYAGQVKKTAALTGMTRTQVQELAAAADDAGVNFETFQAAMLRLSRQGVKDVNGKVWQLIDTFEKVKDPATRSAMAVKLFGKTGQELIPFLAQGKKAVQESIAENRELGVIMGEDDLDAAIAFKKGMKELGDVTEGIRRTVSVPFIKALLKLTKATKDWLDANRVEVMEAVRGAADKVVWVLRAFVNIATDVVNIVKWMVDAFGGWTVAILGITVAMKLFGDSTFLVTLKWLAIAAVIALVVEDFSAFLKGQPSLIEDISKALDAFWNDWSPEAAKKKLADLEKHPVLNFLRTMLWTITHIGETWDTWIEHLTNNPAIQMALGGGELAAKAKDRMKRAELEGVKASPVGWAREMLNDPSVSMNDIRTTLADAGFVGKEASSIIAKAGRPPALPWGTGVSPSESARAAREAKAAAVAADVSPVTPLAPTVNVTVNAKTDASAQEIADLAGETVSKAVRQARSSLVPAPQE